MNIQLPGGNGRLQAKGWAFAMSAHRTAENMGDPPVDLRLHTPLIPIAIDAAATHSTLIAASFAF
jgi:hypothetical protein